MNIYKEAQAISFVNEALIVNFETEANRNPTLWSYADIFNNTDAYISQLSAIYNEMAESGIGLGQAVRATTSGGAINIIFWLIGDVIGPSNFINQDISNVLAKLDQLIKSSPLAYAGPETQEEAPVEPAVEPEPEPETETNVDSAPSESMREPVAFTDIIDDRTFSFLKKDPKNLKLILEERLREVKAYCEFLYNSGFFQEKDLPQRNINEISEAHRDVSDTLDRLEPKELATIIDLRNAAKVLRGSAQRVKLNMEPEEEDLYSEPEETSAPAPRVKPKKTRLPIKNEEQAKKSEVSEANVNAEISKEDGESHILLQDVDLPIDFSAAPPVINWNAVNQFYNNFALGIMNYNDAWLSLNDQSENAIVTYNGEPEESQKKELNKVMYAFKTYSAKIVDALNEYISKQSDLEIIKASNDLISEFEKKGPIAKLLDDSAGIISLKDLTIFVSGASAIFKILKSSNSAVLKGYNISPHKDESERERFHSDLKKMINNTFIKKLILFLNLKRRSKDTKFISDVGLEASKLVQNLANLTYNRKKVYKKPCPICFKEIIDTPSETFTVRLFSMFRERDNSPITYEDLNFDPDNPRKPRRFPAPTPGMFSKSKEEGRYVSNFTGSKTWEEIQEMIRSHNASIQREGLHRRSFALMSLGAKPLKEANISDIFRECPSSGEGRTSCGLSYNSSQSMSELGEFGLQPSWNGLFRSSDHSESIDEAVIESNYQDNSVYSAAKAAVRSGFKFSKVTFACPCHIKNADKDINEKYSDIVIPKSGIFGHSSGVPALPTTPSGSPSELPEGTFAFLVCGAETSMSLFNRNPDSDGYILKYLKDLKQTYDNDVYQTILEDFIIRGFDIESLMALDEMVDKYDQEGLVSESKYKFNIRKKVLNDLINKIAINIRDNRSFYNNFPLVCPFGHEFTVEQSLSFGEHYVAFRQSNLLKFSDIIESTGYDNLTEVLSSGKFLERTDGYSGIKGLPYEEWIQLPLEKRTYHPDIKHPDKVALLIRVPGRTRGEFDEYFILPARENVWRGFGSLETQYRRRTIGGEYTVRTESTQASGKDSSDIDVTDARQAQAWMAEEIEDKDFHYVGEQKGFPDRPKGSGRKQFDSLIYDFSILLKQTLKTIHVYTSSIISKTFVSALFKDDYNIDIAKDFDFNKFNKLLKEEYFTFDGNTGKDHRGNDPVHEMAMYQLYELFIPIINEAFKDLSGWILENAAEFEDDFEFLEEMLTKIFVNSLNKAIEKYNDEQVNNPNEYEFYQEEVEKEIDDPKRPGAKKKQMAFKSDIYKHIKEKIRYIGEIKKLLDVISFNNNEFITSLKEKQKLMTQLQCVSYGLYLADTLSKLYRKYLSDGSNYYIGYNIGVNLASRASIVGTENNGTWAGGINPSESENIVSSLYEAIINGLPKDIRDDECILRAQKLDNLYFELKSALEDAERNIRMNSLMVESKNFLIDKLTYQIGMEREESADRVGGILTTMRLSYGSTPKNIQTGMDVLPMRLNPHISKGVTLLNQDLYPGTIVHALFRTEDKLAEHYPEIEPVMLFRSVEEMQEYIDKINTEYPDWKIQFSSPLYTGNTQFLPGISIPKRWKINEISYITNDDIGFDGTQYQVRMYGNKSTAILKGLLLDESSFYTSKYGYAGIPIPISSGETSGKKRDNNFSKLASMNILDYRVEVMAPDYNGDMIPTDISFLFQRGSSKKDYNNLLIQEQEILTIQIKAENDIIKKHDELRDSKDPEIRDNADALLSEYRRVTMEKCNSDIALIVKKIKKLPLVIRTASTISGISSVISPSSDARQAGILQLSSPKTCMRLIENPELRGVKLTEDEKQRLREFVIGVYGLDLIDDMIKRLAKTAEHHFPSLLDPNFNLGDLPKGRPQFPALINTAGTWTDLDGNIRPRYKDAFSTMCYSIIPDRTHIDYGVSAAARDLIRRKGAQHMTIGDFHNTTEQQRNAGLARSSESIGPFTTKLTEKVRRYILDSVTPKKKNARRKKEGSTEFSSRIFKRAKELERIMFAMDVLDFDDVEIPDFD